MSVALLPYGQPRNHFCDISNIPLNDVHWPLNNRPDGDTLADLGASDHVIVIASSRVLTLRTESLCCRVSVFLCEPPAVQKHLYSAIRWRAKQFCYVLTHNTNLIQTLPNARFVAHGGTMIGNIHQPFIAKTNRIALIASSKKSTKGHRLRHAIAKWAAKNVKDFHALGRGYNPLVEKADGHNSYLFSVVIENSREPGYFTEKLVDSFLCHSLPIYWGAPDISHFFDPRGIINCSSASELKAAVANLTAEDYHRRKPFLIRNREIALEFLNLWGRAAQLANDLDELSLATDRQVEPNVNILLKAA